MARAGAPWYGLATRRPTAGLAFGSVVWGASLIELPAMQLSPTAQEAAAERDRPRPRVPPGVRQRRRGRAPRPVLNPTPIEENTISRQANIAAQEHLAENINAGNIDVAVQSFAENAVDHDPAPDQGPGRDGFRSFFETLTTAFPDAKIEPDTLVADDDHVCVAYTLTGTHEGEFQGIKATGKRIEVRGVQIGRFEHAQIVERWGSTDELGILDQLGAKPA